MFLCDLGGRFEIYRVVFKLHLAEFHEVGYHPERTLFERPCQLSYGDWIWNLNRHREVWLTTNTRPIGRKAIRHGGRVSLAEWLVHGNLWRKAV